MDDNEFYVWCLSHNIDYEKAGIKDLREYFESEGSKLFTFIPEYDITVSQALKICKYTGIVYCVDYKDDLIATMFVFDGSIQEYDTVFSCEYQVFESPGYFDYRLVDYVKPDSPTGVSKSLKIKTKKRMG